MSEFNDTSKLISLTLFIELYFTGNPNTGSSTPEPNAYENNDVPVNDVPWYITGSPKLIPLLSNISNFGDWLSWVFCWPSVHILPSK